MPVKVNALDHLVINVSDVARSAEWYAKILDMEIRLFDPGEGRAKRTSLMFGDQKINVRPGHRRAEATPFFERLCPAMTKECVAPPSNSLRTICPSPFPVAQQASRKRERQPQRLREER